MLSVTIREKGEVSDQIDRRYRVSVLTATIVTDLGPSFNETLPSQTLPAIAFVLTVFGTANVLLSTFWGGWALVGH